MNSDRIHLERRKQEGTQECQINLRNRKAIIEGTEDLPDDTPVTVKIGSRSIICDELKNLRLAVAGGSDAQSI